MRIGILTPIVLLVSAVTFANPVDLELGQEVYESFCQGCHGSDKSGLEGYAGSMEDFRARLDGATDDMPDFAGYFEEDEILSMYEYLMDSGD
ncbi:MAG: c-type cytochrome [Gammaproteobacteria bacterium]